MKFYGNSELMSFLFIILNINIRVFNPKSIIGGGATWNFRPGNWDQVFKNGAAWNWDLGPSV